MVQKSPTPSTRESTKLHYRKTPGFKIHAIFLLIHVRDLSTIETDNSNTEYLSQIDFSTSKYDPNHSVLAE